MQWTRVAGTSRVVAQKTGRSVLVVSPDPCQRRAWAASLERSGYRAVTVDSASEARQLLTAITVRAAVICQVRLQSTGRKRSAWNSLFADLCSVPTLLVLNDNLSPDDIDRRSSQLLARVHARNEDDPMMSTQFGVQHLASDPALRN